MGSPRKLRKQYQKPSHPWQKERIEEEKKILKEYGLKNKREIWKMNSILRGFTGQAKKLAASQSNQGKKEREQMMAKLQKYGLIKPGANLDDVLGISFHDILERRLQTLVYKKGLAHSMKQARQFITHEHIKIGEQKMTIPSYLVPITEEPVIMFAGNSSLADPEHPERSAPKATIAAPVAAASEAKEDRQGARQKNKDPRSTKSKAVSQTAQPIEASA